MIPKFLAKIKDNKVKMEEPFKARCWEYLRGLEGKEVEVTITLPKDYPQRSGQQNRYYHGVVLELLSEHLGYTPEEVHEILKQKFLGEVLSAGGQEFSVGKSTTELDTVQMENFMDRVRIWASIEFSVVIPEPNEVA